MHIGMIHCEANTFPPDIRVEKEVRVLAPAGHRVSILCRRISNQQAETEEYIDGVKIFRRNIPMIKMGGLPARHHFDLIYRDWLKPIANFIESEQPDVLHVHDLRLVPTTLKVAEKFNIPVVADLHENLPAAFVAFRSQWHPLRKLQYWFIQNYHLWRWHERWATRRCARVIVVVQEQADRFYNWGIPQKRVVLVANTEDETTFVCNSKDADPDILERYEGHFVVSYIGAGGAHRGLDTAVKAVPMAASKISNFLLVIVGTGMGRREPQLKRMLERKGVSKQVQVVGWQPSGKVNAYVLASKACLVPHKDFEHTQMAAPHKLFQYMICGRPVVVSDCRPLKRIVQETGAGLVFKAGDPEDLACQLVKLWSDPVAAEAMGKRGRKAALGPYAWRHDAQRLVAIYQELEDASHNKL